MHTQGDCYVSLSRGEGWGMGAYEAAWFGKPIVATDHAGHREYLELARNISLRLDETFDRQTMEQIRTAARRSYSEEFIERLPQGYDSLVGERGVKLSGGQRQRLAIARELFKEPGLLILDEATSSLDSESESYIQRSLHDLRGTMTVIIIAHRLSTIKEADYIFVLDGGRVVEEGRFSDLAQKETGAFRRMCELQQVI